MRNLFIFLFVFALLNITNSIFAEEKKVEWTDPDYNFRQIKTVMVQYSISDDLKLDELEKTKIMNQLSDTFFKSSKKTKLKFISLQQAEEIVGKASNTNIIDLKTNDPAQYENIMSSNLPSIVNAILKMKVKSQGYTTKHIPEGTETVTEHHYTYITEWHNNPNGFPYTTTRTIDNPTTSLRTIPAHDIMVGHAGVEFELFLNGTSKTIWNMTDIREANNKQPIDMTERILNRAIKRLTDLSNGKK